MQLTTIQLLKKMQQVERRKAESMGRKETGFVCSICGLNLSYKPVANCKAHCTTGLCMPPTLKAHRLRQVESSCNERFWQGVSTRPARKWSHEAGVAALRCMKASSYVHSNCYAQGPAPNMKTRVSHLEMSHDGFLTALPVNGAKIETPISCYRASQSVDLRSRNKSR
jgi:hypothetical protein